MIGVHGPEGSAEYRAAEDLRDLMLEWSPNLESDPRNRVWIVAEAQCYGQAVQDVDLLVLAAFGGSTPLHLDANGVSARFHSLCFTVEVKTHTRDSIEFQGTHAFVRYDGDRKSATRQSEQQQHSLRRYLAPKLKPAPFCVNLLWLRNVARRDIPEPPHNIVSGQADWREFLSRLRDSRMAPRRGSSGIDKEYDVGPLESVESAAKLFTERLPASRLDRARMERVAQRWLKTQQYAERLGEQLLIFRGRGGTGKTAALLRIAHDIHQSYGQRVLILTYHRALVSDLTRLFALMSLSTGVRTGGIRIRTVHSFIRGIATNLAGYSWSWENSFSAEYERCKEFTLEILGAATPEDFRKLKRSSPEEFDWDYIFVDEAQDWPADERDILYRVYDSRTFVLADGVDQYVRSNRSIDWTKTPEENLAVQRIPLRKVLRLKAGLCRFVQSFAAKMGLGDWSIEPDPGAQGGRIIIVEGSYFDDRLLHESIVEANAKDGNELIDMLFCVPPDDVKSSGDRRASMAGSQFRQWGYKVWDGVDPDQRDSFPTDLDQLRILQYESCRGLEGWTVVNLGFDRFFDMKLRQSPQTESEEPELLFDPRQAAETYAAQWLMIPLTRAVDTLVIEIRSFEHPVGQALRAAATECGAIVECVRTRRPTVDSIPASPVGKEKLEIGGFGAGDAVIHTIFGKGEILRVWDATGGARAEIKFRNVGTKTISLSASPIRKL
jgi:hypothetical protein